MPLISRKTTLTRFSMLLSLFLIALILSLSTIFVLWLWGVPTMVDQHIQDISELKQLLNDQQIIMNQLSVEKEQLAEALKYHSNNISEHIQNHSIGGEIIIGRSKLENNRDANQENIPDEKEILCSLSKDSGPCTTSSMQRWYYDSVKGMCKQFTYGGCEGNSNNFLTVLECENTCRMKILKSDDSYSAVETRVSDGLGGVDDSEEICEKPPVSGPCRSHLTRYYYSSSSDTCEQFSYGGCAGNKNNFVSVQQCQATCQAEKASQNNYETKKIKSKTVEKIVNVQKDSCNIIFDYGSCNEQVKRWFFNESLGDCESFTWSGCRGNSNNFISQKKCKSRCLEK